jgi:hypothetical protein
VEPRDSRFDGATEKNDWRVGIDDDDDGDGDDDDDDDDDDEDADDDGEYEGMSFERT